MFPYLMAYRLFALVMTVDITDTHNGFLIKDKSNGGSF